MLKNTFIFQKRERRGETNVEVRTRKMQHLPLIDLMIHDYGKKEQGFGFEIGPVCFS